METTLGKEISGIAKGSRGKLMKDKVLVSVLCTTYNHESFIADAIEGVISQKVNFKYELIIHEDASTDKTADIVKKYADKYPELIRVIFQKENQFQYCNIYETFLFPEVRGKYIALCEGDDYWTDENKLQMQVDFLEKNPEYSMCMHNAIKRNFETGEESLLDTFPEDGTYSQEEQIKAGLGTDFPAFASYVIRTELLQEIPQFFLAQKVLDYPLRQYFSDKGKVYYFQKPMSVYRTATPQSYMRKTAQSQVFYNNYTLDMIRFFENFDVYTEKRFHEIIQNKLISDYFGYCLSIEEGDGKKKAMEHGLDMDKIDACYQCFSLDNIRRTLSKFQNHTSHIFIYGISRISAICRRQLVNIGVDFVGYVVSDGQMKPEEIEGKKVYHLHEVLSEYQNPGFILAIQPVNANVIINILRKNGVENYCEPYKIK